MPCPHWPAYVDVQQAPTNPPSSLFFYSVVLSTFHEYFQDQSACFYIPDIKLGLINVWPTCVRISIPEARSPTTYSIIHNTFFHKDQRVTTLFEFGRLWKHHTQYGKNAPPGWHKEGGSCNQITPGRIYRRARGGELRKKLVRETTIMAALPDATPVVYWSRADALILFLLLLLLLYFYHGKWNEKAPSFCTRKLDRRNVKPWYSSSSLWMLFGDVKDLSISRWEPQ